MPSVQPSVMYAATPSHDREYQRQLGLLIVTTALLRLVGAATMDLGVDEAYALAVARPVSASYFDHPPMVFWLTAAAQQITGSSAPVVLRLPFIALFAITTWAIGTLGRTLFGARAGLFGAVVLNLCGVLGFSDASWILPDGPLLCGLSVAAMAFAHICFGTRNASGHHAAHEPWWWMVVGAGAGLAGLSKYHAIFLPLGMLVFIASTRRWPLLASPWPWLGGVLAIAMVSPVLWWNATHEWASLRFQVGRAANASRGLHLAPFFEILAGQIGYVLPWVWAPLMWATWHALRRGRSDERSWLLLWLAAGPLVVFTLVTLGGSRGLPHWQGPGYLFLTPLLGAALATRWQAGATWPLTWMRRSALTIVALATIVVTQSAFGWVNRLAPSLFTKGDPSLEAVGWDALAPALASRGLLADTTVAYVATTHWIEAAKAAVAVNRALPVLALTDDPRGFQFAHNPMGFRGRHGLLVRRASEAEVDSAMRARFGSVDAIGTVPIRRAGVTVFTLQLYRVTDLR